MAFERKFTYSIDIFSIRSAEEFDKCCLEVFKFQSVNNRIYKQYLDIRKIVPETIKSVNDIPFLPIEFFRNHAIFTGTEYEKIFESSASNAQHPGRHFIKYLDLYNKSLEAGFNMFFGSPSEYVILALLPSYLERGNSSLVYMVKRLMDLSENEEGGFYLNNVKELLSNIREFQKSRKKILLFGVSFALLDLAEMADTLFSGLIIIETGGMKGRRKEITRQELHERLKIKLGVDHICSEYGMTELLSQAYSIQNEGFKNPPQMKIKIRDLYDPYASVADGTTGGINVIDLANVYSCPFIETQDLGRIIPGKGFEVLGRIDQSATRGCNLMVD